nr:hypothetical protein [Entomoplasma sp. MP1]
MKQKKNHLMPNKIAQDSALLFASELDNNSNKDTLLYGIPYFAKDNLQTKISKQLLIIKYFKRLYSTV